MNRDAASGSGDPVGAPGHVTTCRSAATSGRAAVRPSPPGTLVAMHLAADSEPVGQSWVGKGWRSGSGSRGESGGLGAADCTAPAVGAVCTLQVVCAAGGDRGLPGGRGPPGGVRFRRPVWAFALEARQSARTGGSAETKASTTQPFSGRLPACGPRARAEPRAPQRCASAGGDRVIA